MLAGLLILYDRDENPIYYMRNKIELIWFQYDLLLCEVNHIYLLTFTTHQYIMKPCILTNFNHREILKYSHGQCDSGPQNVFVCLKQMFCMLAWQCNFVVFSLVIEHFMVVHLCTSCYCGNYINNTRETSFAYTDTRNHVYLVMKLKSFLQLVLEPNKTIKLITFQNLKKCWCHQLFMDKLSQVCWIPFSNNWYDIKTSNHIK